MSFKTLTDRLRSKRPEPTVWHGLTRDMWPDPRATGHGWYCGQCGNNKAQYYTDADAKRAAQEHARAHSGVNVAPWT